MPIVTVRNLATIGGWGNQCFLYCFCKAYAAKMGCELQCPDWPGRTILANANEPLISANLLQSELDSRSKKPLLYFNGAVNIDLNLYGQHQCYIDFYTRAQARAWLRLKPEFEQYAPHLSYSYSAIHKRLGDYVTNPTLSKLYCQVSNESYRRAVEQFKIPGPVYHIYEEHATPQKELIENGVSWLTDFLFLRDAAHLLRANSTFSFWASVLGHGITYSPVVSDRVGLQDCEFVLGNHSCTAGKFANQSDLHLKA